MAQQRCGLGMDAVGNFAGGTLLEGRGTHPAVGGMVRRDSNACGRSRNFSFHLDYFRRFMAGPAEQLRIHARPVAPAKPHCADSLNRAGLSPTLPLSRFAAAIASRFELRRV